MKSQLSLLFIHEERAFLPSLEGSLRREEANGSVGHVVGATFDDTDGAKYVLYLPLNGALAYDVDSRVEAGELGRRTRLDWAKEVVELWRHGVRD